MFTHKKYKARGLNMPYYKAAEAGYITWEEYNDLKSTKKNNNSSTNQQTTNTPPPLNSQSNDDNI